MPLKLVIALTIRFLPHIKKYNNKQSWPHIFFLFPWPYNSLLSSHVPHLLSYKIFLLKQVKHQLSPSKYVRDLNAKYQYDLWPKQSENMSHPLQIPKIPLFCSTAALISSTHHPIKLKTTWELQSGINSWKWDSYTNSLIIIFKKE